MYSQEDGIERNVMEDGLPKLHITVRVRVIGQPLIDILFTF